MRYNKVETNTLLVVNNSIEGETIETKIERITTMREPITDGAPLIYTERDAGCEAQYDIRTDRFEVALEAMDTVNRSYRAKREAKREAEKAAKDLKEGVTSNAVESVNTSDK